MKMRSPISVPELLALCRLSLHYHTDLNDIWVPNFWLSIIVFLCRGYMAPEYALWGYLTYKADVYSFGVVALEIVSGKSNNNYLPDDESVCLLDWVC